MNSQSELIFRLETRDGQQGAYRVSGKFAYDPESRHSYDNQDLHPGPRWDDPMDFQQGKHIFGFVGLPNARRWWFDVEDLRDWNRDGLRLAVWPARLSEEIVYGKRQIAFTRPEEDPIYLPAYAIHEFSEETFRDLVKDHFGE